MTIRNFHSSSDLELPLHINISFKMVYDLFVKYTDSQYEGHPYHVSAKHMVEEINKIPELIEGFSDFSLLEKHEEIIDLVLDPLFPEILSGNEIKAATVPFSFTCFKFTKRFETILENAGKDYLFEF